MTEQRRLAAILVADVAGYSRPMGQDECGTPAALKSLRQQVVDLMPYYGEERPGGASLPI